MSSNSKVERRQYWLEGVATVPFVTRRKVVRTIALGTLSVLLLLGVSVSQNVWLALAALACIALAVVMWFRRDADGGRWVMRPINRVRAMLGRQARWDEFDPDVETRPFWLRFHRVLAVSSPTGGNELCLLDEGLYFVAVLEVDGGGNGIQQVAQHVRREQAFQNVLRTAARRSSGVVASQLDFITRSVSAMDEDVEVTEFAEWVTPAIKTSMRQLAEESKRKAQQIRSWVAIRMPVNRLEERVRAHGAELTDESLSEAAFESVSQVSRLLMSHDVRVHRGLSPRRLAAVIRSFLLPNWSADDTSGIREFWDAWPAFVPTQTGTAVAVFEGDSADASWYHMSGSIPRSGWPTEPVQGRWLASLVLSSQLSHRVVMTSYALIPPGEALSLAHDQLTTAASLRIRERNQGKVSMGDKAHAESSAQIVGADLAVRAASGVRTLTRVMVSAESMSALDRAREEVETITGTEMAVTEFWWDDDRATLGVLAALPLGRELPHDN